MTRLCPDKSFMSLCHLRRVAGLTMLCKVNWKSNHCLFSELPSASNVSPMKDDLALCSTGCVYTRYLLFGTCTTLN